MRRSAGAQLTTESCDSVPALPGYCECGGGRQVALPLCAGPLGAHSIRARSCAEACAEDESAYALLGLGDGAKEPAIKSAFRRASLRLHPDKARREGAEAAEATAVRFEQACHRGRLGR